jgi:hypothetical protein
VSTINDLDMPIRYPYAVKLFFVSVILCGAIYLLGDDQIASLMLITTGCVGMALAVGSAAGWIEVLDKDGKVIPAMKIGGYSSELVAAVSLTDA